MAAAEADLGGCQRCVLGVVIEGIATQHTFNTGQMLEAFCHVGNFKVCIAVDIKKYATGQIIFVNFSGGDDLLS